MNDELVGFILAAGYSKRLKESTKDNPKSFLEINGKKIIDYHLENLSRLGVKKTYIVVGFQKNMVKETLGEIHKGMDLEYIDNDDFEITGHSYSLFLGREVFRKNDILLIHADVFCDPEIYDEVFKTSIHNMVLVDENYSIKTGDEFFVQGDKDFVSEIGPNMSEKVQGEYLGINKFNKIFLTKLCDYMEEFFQKESRKLNYELLIDKFLKESNFKINYKKINGKKWMNINYIEDYEKAKEIARDFENKKHINL